MNAIILYEKLLTTRKSHLLKPKEILTAIKIPLGAKRSCQKHTQQTSHYLVVGIFVCKREDCIRVGITGTGAHAFLSLELEKALREDWRKASVDFCSLYNDHLIDDMHAKKDFKLRLIKYLAGQCVRDIH